MDRDSREKYQRFLLHGNVAIDFFEFREGALRMNSLADRLVDGWCSVYTFFEPDVSGSSVGTYNVLWQIERCRTLGLLDRREPKDGPQSDVPPWRGWWGALAGTVGEAVQP